MHPSVRLLWASAKFLSPVGRSYMGLAPTTLHLVGILFLVQPMNLMCSSTQVTTVTTSGSTSAAGSWCEALGPWTESGTPPMC